MGRSFARSKKRQDLTSKSLAYVVLIVACLLVIAPFTIVIATSFKTYQDSVKIPFSFYMGYLDTSSYKEIITDKDLWNGLMNTLIIVVPISPAFAPRLPSIDPIPDISFPNKSPPILNNLP